MVQYRRKAHVPKRDAAERAASRARTLASLEAGMAGMVIPMESMDGSVRGTGVSVETPAEAEERKLVESKRPSLGNPRL